MWSWPVLLFLDQLDVKQISVVGMDGDYEADVLGKGKSVLAAHEAVIKSSFVMAFKLFMSEFSDIVQIKKNVAFVSIRCMLILLFSLLCLFFMLALHTFIVWLFFCLVLAFVIMFLCQGPHVMCLF